MLRTSYLSPRLRMATGPGPEAGLPPLSVGLQVAMYPNWASGLWALS